ncbi:NADH:ubiquinone oxidoreductase 6.6kD subunit [Metarhizium anisopliae]|uniref:NADH:ubiquinone oxidoreductase 6.6kD subunit n=1 Tax=Metarhizium robertsii (strain ARSEF 23 / ATCC MYA-3075) TaxID=655844 RepID=E9F9J3_METRA|nr:NADH:ubiquinone oxidoreductase 6.6kD subunit [Metarhizium robertsii ARSEF 23]EFY95646.2 NADH:ubiquinone oxidoreductase 6.6kD subunit [Metarhizium robertsii ARSEF 23]KFG82698.1 NADH:ubiquinone oxidoreductase 6.6kD subunit [Metarhizium anisopliae]
MAHLNVKPDPAYLKHQGVWDPRLRTLVFMGSNEGEIAMQKTRHHFFRWTPRTARITFMYVAVVPAIFGYVAYKTDGLYNFRAKRRGDTIYER